MTFYLRRVLESDLSPWLSRGWYVASERTWVMSLRQFEVLIRKDIR